MSKRPFPPQPTAWWRWFALGLALFFLLAPGHASLALAGEQADFTSAWREFRRLDKGASDAKFRSSWTKLADKFMAVYKKRPTGPYAPKSLYYLGRVYQELGERSGSAKDFQKSCDYFGRVLSRFPNHSWTDDCVYRRGTIRLERLDSPDLAYSDFLTIVHKYPKGDMYAQAKARLAEMDRNTAKAQKKDTKTAKAAPPAKHKKSSVMAVRYRNADDYTRVVLDMDAAAKFRYQLLAPMPELGKPHRVYVDLESATLSSGVHPEIRVADGILRRIRTGQKDPDTARVVLDFQELQDFKVFPLENPFRIVIDVYAPDNKEAVAQARRKAAAGPQSSNSVKYTPPPGSKQVVGDLVEQLGLTIETIMLDPGHGGKDPGATGWGLKEKDINLRFTKILAKMLKEKGFKVVFTRTKDVFIPLEERTAMANVQKADMFLSVHCNAYSSPKISGLETYSLNLARTRSAVRVAARENAISPKRISDLQVILTDLMLSSKMKESSDLAKRLEREAVKSVRRKYKLRSNGAREAPFYVLMGAKMPSVLIELGYITNRTEAGRLNSDAYLRYLARGVVNGVMAYKSQIERYASLNGSKG